ARGPARQRTPCLHGRGGASRRPCRASPPGEGRTGPARSCYARRGRGYARRGRGYARVGWKRVPRALRPRDGFPLTAPWNAPKLSMLTFVFKVNTVTPHISSPAAPEWSGAAFFRGRGPPLCAL